MTPSGHISTLDLVETADRMLAAAAAIVTGRLHLASASETRRRLVARDPLAVGYFRHELARQVAALLLMDPQVTAVYEEQEVPPAEELEPAEATLAEPLHLIVQVEFETAALRALIDATNDALGQAVRGVLPVPEQGLVWAEIIDRWDRHRLRPRANGYRPAPLLLASRGDGSASDAI